jgi:hypothetical protein
MPFYEPSEKMFQEIQEHLKEITVILKEKQQMNPDDLFCDNQEFMKIMNISKSRAIRRSANKIIDYLCWILVATSFGEAFGTPFGIPILPALVLLVVYGCEINSCFNNYFEARGSKLRINIFKWLKNKSDIMVPSDDENDTTKT